MKRVGLVILVFLLYAVSAEAGLTVEDYGRAKSQSWFNLYIGGIGQGISIANTWLKTDKKIPLFCVADDRILDATDYISLIDAYLVKNKDKLTLETPISAVLLFALKEAYPCGKGTVKRK
jgi:hypothetical protein